MIDFIIIRHGETVENANNICQGQQHGKLSKLGIRQAKLLAVGLKDEPIDVIYSSDLQRTIDTANKILNFHSQLQLQLDPLLRERSLSLWEGKPFPKNWKWEYLPEGAETNEDMLKRAKDFIHKILMKHDGQCVAAITHGGMIRAFKTVIANKTASDYFSWNVSQNTSITRVKLDPNGEHEMVNMNNVDHLGLSTPGTNQSFS